MRATPIAATAVAGLLLLTACDDAESDGKRTGATPSPDGVSMEVGPASVAPAAGDIGEVPVSFTVQGATCTLNGFPEVRLAGAGDPATAEVPPAEGATAQKLTLAEGESASFTLTYERGTRRQGGFDAENLHVGVDCGTGGGGTRIFPWSYGPVAADGRAGYKVSVSAYQRMGD
ncbi:DUF4232 domain-containing protein [Streptomyces sp. NPDC016640]|uniref:DUF4232 domain-containing protein n=1 Tax=Streptomyces sp. NPDC016640 TaxID=3364969 RepID=UPI0037012829